MAYGDFKDLAKITASDKVLTDKVFNVAKNPKHDRYQRGLVSMVYNLQMNFINQLLENFKKKSLFIN